LPKGLPRCRRHSLPSTAKVSMDPHERPGERSFPTRSNPSLRTHSPFPLDDVVNLSHRARAPHRHLCDRAIQSKLCQSSSFLREVASPALYRSVHFPSPAALVPFFSNVSLPSRPSSSSHLTRADIDLILYSLPVDALVSKSELLRSTEPSLCASTATVVKSLSGSVGATATRAFLHISHSPSLPSSTSISTAVTADSTAFPVFLPASWPPHNRSFGSSIRRFSPSTLPCRIPIVRVCSSTTTFGPQSPPSGPTSP
jgi:hypothetical protein